jgi:hypothetical protein
MITLTYTITMGILCLISWGICGYIWYLYEQRERELYLKIYKDLSLRQKKLDYQNETIYRGEIDQKANRILDLIRGAIK